MSKKAIPTEIHDQDGNFKRIEFHDTNGDHIVDVLWDDHEEQTIKNRIEFRKWAYHMLSNKDYLVDK